MGNNNCWHYRRMTPEERFWCRVEKTSTCWLWVGTGRSGYGRFQINGVKVAAHRFAYELLIGPIPDGLYLDHTCHTPSCVNPDHLRPVTSKQNQENQLGTRTDNTSGYRGVCFDKKSGRWVGSVNHHGQRISLTGFTSAEEAAEAVRAKRLELYTHNDTDRDTAGNDKLVIRVSAA